MMNTLIPDDFVSFSPTSSSLWAVWGRAPDYQIESGWSDPIYQKWVIASPGQKGLDEIKEGLGDEYLLAASLEQLIFAHALGREIASGGSNKFLPSWLPGFSNDFFLSKEPGGSLSLSSRRPSSGAQDVIQGRLEDFELVCKKGREIIDEKDYHAVLDDVRPVAPGHPPGWLDMMKFPETIAIRRQAGLLEGYE